VALLRPAAGRFPGDVWVNYALAAVLDRLRPAAREEAVGYYRAARALRPETAHELAHLLERMGRRGEAEAVFRDLVGRRPGSAWHLGCLGHHLKEVGRSADAAPVLDRAIAACREAIQLRPDDASTHNNLGVALHDQGNVAEAIAEFRDAIRLRPDDAGAHNNLGNALRAQGKVTEAIAAHREAIRLRPDNAKAHSDLGNALRAQGKVTEAIAAHREAIRLRPDNAEAHSHFGAILCDVKRDYPAAEAEFREAIRLKPDYASAHYNLGCALAGQGKADEAIAAFREATRLQPDDASAHYNLGTILCDVKRDYPAAETEFREVIRLKPDYASAHGNLGYALSAQGKVAEAIAAFREAIRLQPDDAMAHNNLGAILCDVTHDLTGAAAEFREAIRLRPDDAMAHANLGNALRAQGKVIEAIAAYREAIRLQPDLARAHTSLASALRELRKLDEAIAEYRTAIRLKPDDASAHYDLGSVLEQQGDLDGALAELRAARDRGGPEAERRLPGIGLLIAEAERAIRLRDRLAAVLAGSDRPAGPAEGAAFGELAYRRGRHAAAARLYAAALAADPKLGDDRRAWHRYNAACAALLAAAGQGTDDPKPDDATRARLRGLALEWLNAERAAWAKVLDAGNASARPVVQQALQHWKADPDLAGIRSPDALAKLPEAERATWRSLWAEVDALLARARGGPAPPADR
jgi:tetratricopeptide (TPR) repeat protein